MRKLFTTTLLFVFVTLCSVSFNSINAQNLKNQLEALPSVKRVETLKSGDFAEKYLLYFEQPIDHKNPSLGTFTQRVFVSNVSVDSSTVVVTEGYGAAYGLSERNRSEVSRLFNLNNVVVEHRYFLESTPANLDWTYLTAENQANDLHRVVTELKTIFNKKWISTGSSKGGQNSVIYRSFFPDDVDISVPYVGPFCTGVQDGRHEPFLSKTVGSAQDRKRIEDIQIEFLKRRDRLMPMFEELVKKNGYTYDIPLDHVYDYTVLEYSFTFWQRGHRVDRIPALNASDEELFKYFTGISTPDYWVNNSPTLSFFVMAAKELGYYGYDIKPFKKYLRVKSTKNYLSEIWLPKEIKNIKFDKTLSKKLDKFLKTTDCKILFVYGEYDPWSAVRATEVHDNIHIFIKPEGSHSSNISTLPEEMKKEAMAILSSWLYDKK